MPIRRFCCNPWIAPLWVVVGLLGGCEEAVNPFAPPRPGLVVYAVLDPAADTQFVRVSQFFQYEGDALLFAKAYDPSLTGLKVRLEGEGELYEGVARQNVRTGAGDFGPSVWVYAIPTPDSARLKEGGRYDVYIYDPDSASFWVHGATRVPYRPRIVAPALIPQALTGRFCLPTIHFEDSFRVIFSPQPVGAPALAGGFEASITLTYSVHGEEHTVTYGPSKLITTRNDCMVSGVICYPVPRRSLVSVLPARGLDPLSPNTYQSAPVCGNFRDLARAVQVRVAAVDSALANYLRVNDPGQVNFNEYRKEYTNLTSSVQVAGVVGAIAYHHVPVALDPCTAYLLGLNGAQRPSDCPLR